MLLILGVWRHLIKKFPLRYDPLYWGAVFPLGMVVTFRCAVKGDPWAGDWVAWVGSWDCLARIATGAADLMQGEVGVQPPVPSGPGREGGEYLVRLKDNLTSWDCAYEGLESLADGTLVATTYGTWAAGEQPSILSVRFTLAELDAMADATPAP